MIRKMKIDDRKWHGLLLRGAMVRQRLTGAKTSTMRPMGRHNTLIDGKMPDPELWESISWQPASIEPIEGMHALVVYAAGERMVLRHRIRRGDGIWFRECFALSQHDPDMMEPDAKNHDHWDGAVYRADGEDQGGGWFRQEVNAGRAQDVERIAPPWRPGIHMPRWACRLTATVVADPYPRRPCDLTPSELKSEGFPLPADDADHPGATFAEFWEALHPGEPMDQWCWFYPLDAHQETDKP